MRRWRVGDKQRLDAASSPSEIGLPTSDAICWYDPVLTSTSYKTPRPVSPRITGCGRSKIDRAGRRSFADIRDALRRRSLLFHVDRHRRGL